MSRKNKRNKGSKHQVPPAARTAAEPKKIPRVGEDVDFWKSRPIWSFALLDLVAAVGGWIYLKETDLDMLLRRFQKWETMTWGQIPSEGRTENHPIDVIKCSPQAQKRLKVLKLDDREQLMSLSINSKARVIGILDGATFHILWWDPEHEICPSHKRHT